MGDESSSMPAEPAGERFLMSGRIDQVDQVLIVQGPWRDLTGVVGAQSRYTVDPPLAAGFNLAEADLPPDGSYPGRMNFAVGSGAQAKKHQMVDRMALRFRRSDDDKGDDKGVVVEGEGTNRVGRYYIRGTCSRSGSGWELELTRTYTPLARPLQRADSEVTRKRAVDLGVSDLEPRKPRAAAPPKGAWGAQPKKDDAKPGQTPAKKAAKKDDGRPCVVVVFNGAEDHASVYRYASVSAARPECQGVPEVDYALRVGSDAGDGVLFPPADLPPAKLPQPNVFPVPTHVVILHVHAPSAKSRAWKPTVYGFDTARRAAGYAIHCYKTCGNRLVSLEWHAFNDVQDTAIPRLSLAGDGTFDAALPIHDYAMLDAAARPEL